MASSFSDAVKYGLTKMESKTSLLEGMQSGENGSLEYDDSGVGSSVLAISQLVRGGDPTALADAILISGSSRDIADLVVQLFLIRNTRGGKGEKKLAFDVFLRVWKHLPETAKDLMKLFPHYGYWKDLLILMEMSPEDECLQTAALEIIHEQFLKDIHALDRYKAELALCSADANKLARLQKRGPQLSLLAKWLPREGSKFDKNVGFVDRFVDVMWPGLLSASKQESWKSGTKAKYRKIVAELTSFFKLPEVLLAMERADEIDFSKVASKATFLLTKAFLNETKNGEIRSQDPKRIRMAELFVDRIAKKGLKGAQLMPHEIVTKIYSRTKISLAEEKALDAQWKDVWKKAVDAVRAKAKEEGIEFDPTQMVPLSDVSYSMTGVTMMVSIALGIGISEITHDAFKNLVLTFESRPKWHRLGHDDTIVQKVRSLKNAAWGGSTNFEAAYDLILQVCEDHKLSRADMPTLIVFSDMQFNAASGHGADTMFVAVKAKVKRIAQRLGWDDHEPTPMIFWNLRNTHGHPVAKDTEGTVLLSGFSPSLLKYVLHGEALREEEVEVVNADGTTTTTKIRVTPEELLRKMLDDPMYHPVKEILVRSQEGKLAGYQVPLEELTVPMAFVGLGEEEFELV